MSNEETKPFHAGLIALAGLPNAGKSTLLNTIIGEKIAIVSHTPQTTRNAIYGIKTTKEYQAIFVDTPGFHSPKNTLNKAIVQQAVDSLSIVDVICLLVEAGGKRGKDFNNLVSLIKEAPQEKILIITKIDAVPYSLEGTTPSLPITAAATIDASELVIQDNQSEAIFTYTASITIDTSDGVDEVVTKLNTKELSDANLVWSNDGGVFKLSQINYSSASNTIPVKIFISESDIQVKLGLDKVTTQTGSPEVPANDIGTCVYSTQTEGFIIQGSVASASQTIDYATGDMASILGLAETDGGYITKGTNGENLTEMLNNIGRINGDYVSIASINKIDTTDYEQIATWVNASGGRYAFIVISDDARLKSTNQIVYENLFGNDGFILIYGSNINMLAFMQAAIASVDFSVPGGMTNFNFIETPEFLDDSIGTSEELDGINANRANCCYIMGGYGQSQPLFGEGKIFGTNFNNIANYIGNSWIKAKMEIAGANLMISQGFIALRGGKGQSLILASLQEIIALAKVSDIIVTVGTDGLLAAEKAKIVSVTGNANAVNLIESNGYYINVLPLTADDIANEQMRVQFIYTKNVPLNRLVVQNIVI